MTETITVNPMNSGTMLQAIKGGFVFHVEFGNAEADPWPSHATMCRTIDVAREVFRKFRHTADMCLVKVYNPKDTDILRDGKTLYSGWTR